jgi:hypothetical protein
MSPPGPPYSNPVAAAAAAAGSERSSTSRKIVSRQKKVEIGKRFIFSITTFQSQMLDQELHVMQSIDFIKLGYKGKPRSLADFENLTEKTSEFKGL